MSRDATSTPGVTLGVTAVGSMCPLKIGEIVTTTGSYSFDFLGDGHVVSFDVRRESGEIVTISRGDGFGAQFEVREFPPEVVS